MLSITPMQTQKKSLSLCIHMLYVSVMCLIGYFSSLITYILSQIKHQLGMVMH